MFGEREEEISIDIGFGRDSSFFGSAFGEHTGCSKLGFSKDADCSDCVSLLASKSNCVTSFSS